MPRMPKRVKLNVKWINKAINYIFVPFIGMAALFLFNKILPPSIGGMFFGSYSDSYPFTMQMFMWIPFFVGIAEVFLRFKGAKIFEIYFYRRLLPEDESTILSKEDLGNIYSKAKSEKGDNEEGYLPKLILTIVSQFQTNKSVGMATNVLNSQLDLLYHQLELKYTRLKYLVWLIPTMGFMGTVYGISKTVATVGKTTPDDPNLLAYMAKDLAIAFDTTLLALVQSAILLCFVQLIENREESLLNKVGEYTLKNLINRLIDART